MFRKINISRTQSATKLVTSKKLPHDFFTPSLSTKQSANYQSQLTVKQTKSIDKNITKAKD